MKDKKKPHYQLDHIVMAAHTLEQGIAYLQEKLGVTLPLGGEHPLMGTHNCLMQLSPETFFEIIAINPHAPAPNRPRWFGLDNPLVQAALEERPRVLGYLLNTDDLDNAIQRIPIGEKVRQQRADLRWHISIPPDGSLPAAGLLPMLIQWQQQEHPAKNMPDVGCRLEALHLHTPYPNWLQGHIDALAFQADWLQVHDAARVKLELELHTPTKGIVRLD